MSKNNKAIANHHIPMIDLFGQYVEQGVEAWKKAGEILVVMIDADDSARGKILNKYPWMNVDILASFERIGNGQLYAPLLLDSSPGARRLSQLPYDQQAKLYGSNVEVATVRGGEVITSVRKLTLLNESEARLVLSDTGLRPIHEQSKMAREKLTKTLVKSARYKRREIDDDANPAVEKEDGQDYNFEDAPQDLDAPTIQPENIDECLRQAQQALLKARAFLVEQNAPERLDDYITAALKPIGTLRFLLGGDAQ